MATSDARNTAAAINAAAAAISSADPRYHAPERRRWKDSWARYWCFGSQKRDKRIVPTARGDGGTASGRGWAAAGLAQAGLSLAPPSSPASFVNSSVHSPASFTLPLSAASASMCSPGPTNTMFTIGPYAHETQLVSPPVFSTFTTEPSTAPFTPPPELAHLTTPSSPDVPFAQLIASTLGARTAARGTFSPFSTSSLASPCDTPAGYIPSSRHLYLGSPVGHLISHTSGFLGSETTSGVRDIEFPAQFSPSIGKRGSPFPTFEPFTTLTFDGSSSGAALFQPDASNLEIRPALTFQEDGGMNSSSGVELGSGTDVQGTTDIQGTSLSMPMEDTDANHLSAAVVHKSDNESLVLSAKKDECKSVRAKRFDDSLFNGPAESTRQVFCADAEVKYWNSSGKNGYHSSMTCAASKSENIGTSETRENPAVVKECDKKGTDGGLSHSAETCPILKAVDPILPVLQLYENSVECYWTTSGKTHCSSR